MSYATLQKDLERVTLKKDLDQALERMVDFEEEVNREEEEEDDEEEFEEEEEEEGTSISVQVAGSYFFGLAFGLLIAYNFSRGYKWKK